MTARFLEYATGDCPSRWTNEHMAWKRLNLEFTAS
jgi:hypothetical protein